MMKYVSLILNVVLLVAVAGLYRIHYAEKMPAATASTADTSVVASAGLPSPGVSRIVFVNSDTLLDRYDFIRAKKSEMEAKHKRITAELDAEGERLQNDVENYRQRGAMMTDDQRQKTEEQLMMRQQQLMQKEKSMMSKLDDEQQTINEELFSNLNAYLKEYNAGKHYQFILGYQKGGGILLADDSLDITAAVVDGLNNRYAGKKK
jgi:outer membrane protein